jgi:alkylation response protein AidB-like acyl-CoA dehydrogenase
VAEIEFAKLAREGEDVLRAALRAWLEDNRQPELDGVDGFRLYEYDGEHPPTIADEYGPEVAVAYRRWEAELFAVNLICPHWDVEFGGLGFGPIEMAIVDREFARAGMPRVLRGMGEVMFGPTLIRHGTRVQQERYLPRIITGEDRWCQGFSEPDSGSDLASLKTRGVQDGEELIINGQKVWTSGATRANMIFLLCRTDPAATKHRGITYVVMPMSTPGIEVRPIRQISGTSEFCETFFNDARAPLNNVIGGLGDGWRIANSTLAHERSNLLTQWCIQFDRDVTDLFAEVRAAGRLDSQATRHALVDLYIDNRLLRWQNDRLLEAERTGRRAGSIELTSKLFWSEAHTRLGEVALDALGPTSMIRPAGPGYAVSRWQERFLWSRGLTIAAGTSEIQRNIIAEQGLGLPREPRHERG